MMLHSSYLEFTKPIDMDESTIKKRKKMGTFIHSAKSHQTCFPTRSQQKSFGKSAIVSKEETQIDEVFGTLNEKQKFEMLASLIEKAGLNNQLQFELILRIDSHLKEDPITFLPPELGLYIFTFLNRKELARAAQVCRKWKELAYDRTLLIQKVREGYIYCGECTSLVGQEEDVISRKFRLDYSLAYHIKELHNVDDGKMEIVDFPNGNSYKICPTSCRKCKTELGVRYVSKVEPASSEEEAETEQIERNNHQHELHDNLSGELVNHPSENCIGTFLLKKKKALFPGEPQVAVLTMCTNCNNQVGKEVDIISWSYCLRGQEAFQFTTLQNVIIGESKKVSYSSGQYTVADACCENCQEVLGIKYLQAKDAMNAYKIGTYLVEKPKVKITSVTLPSRRDSSDSLGSNMGRVRRKSSILSLFGFLRKSGQQV
eukprot:TRINITY_DN1048_c0_g1_i1.p1 TRINITY_DN1048_c0_g1~~TRINITY_DN1048_c0_g1_i1.p1  ORF type:complete len:430 (+),score=127.09 TRINITY_DN1048_c0_g1_i1:241-1530(+)